MRFGKLMLGCSVLILAGCSMAPISDSPTADDSPTFAVGSGIPSSVTVEFGRDDVGSPFPPPSGHDASGHARDKMFPRTVVLRAGGSVTFNMGTFHQVAIYDKAVEPGNIDASKTVDLTAPPPAPPGTVIIPDFPIDDPTDRLALVAGEDRSGRTGKRWPCCCSDATASIAPVGVAWHVDRP